MSKNSMKKHYTELSAPKTNPEHNKWLSMNYNPPTEDRKRCPFCKKSSIYKRKYKPKEKRYYCLGCKKEFD